jgi:hypothetical protein
MLRARRHGLLLATISVGLLLSLSACADPPNREMQLAEGAINAARAAGAEAYAPDELQAAEDALARSRDAVDIRDYRLALNHAIDSHERAQNAARMAADGKATAWVDADRALVAATELLTTVQARLRAAERARVPAATLSRAQEVLAAARLTVQEARTALDRSDYAQALTSLRTATAQLTAITGDLDAATPRGARARQ